MTESKNETKELLGFCTRCIRVRWLDRVNGYDSKGNPLGVCLSCAREENDDRSHVDG